MTSSYILSVTTFIYGLAGFLYIVSLIFQKDLIGKLGTWVSIAGIAGNTTGFALRWIESYQHGYGRVPLSNLYESLVFFALTIAVIYIVIEYKYKNRFIGAFAMPLAFLAIAYASLSPDISDQIRPLLPALKSNWLIAHVVTCFIGYAAFAVAFGISLLYLCINFFNNIKELNSGNTALSSRLEMLDEMTHQLVMLGFLFLTAGIITGAVWANSAWGRYWGWDPKETWSLITWFVYAAMLHFRMMRGWKGKRTAFLSIIGFSAVLFTYFGVNLLLTGLHSYG